MNGNRFLDEDFPQPNQIKIKQMNGKKGCDDKKLDKLLKCDEQSTGLCLKDILEHSHRIKDAYGRIITIPTPMVSKDVLKSDWCYVGFTVCSERVDIMETWRIPWLELQNVSLVDINIG
ncbi:hypothetical protein TNCV_4812161 [Trichonephila clavipes]|nr:hypothetical protein TNCV_4812161 [Trichonephila clavipes]